MITWFICSRSKLVWKKHVVLLEMTVSWIWLFWISVSCVGILLPAWCSFLEGGTWSLCGDGIWVASSLFRSDGDYNMQSWVVICSSISVHTTAQLIGLRCHVIWHSSLSFQLCIIDFRVLDITSPTVGMWPRFWPFHFSLHQACNTITQSIWFVELRHQLHLPPVQQQYLLVQHRSLQQQLQQPTLQG